MENTDRNRDNRREGFDENQSSRRNRMEEEDHNTPPGAGEEGLVDLDRDGMIGHTGGFYGGTSYLGSNYGEDWDADTEGSSHHEGNYGAAGQQDTERENPDLRDSGEDERKPGRLTNDDSIF